MNTFTHSLSQAFTTLVLKPFDWLLFGGAGVLTRSQEDWRADFEAMRAVRGASATTEVDAPEIDSPVMVNPRNWGESPCLLLHPELPQEITPDEDSHF